MTRHRIKNCCKSCIKIWTSLHKTTSTELTVDVGLLSIASKEQQQQQPWLKNGFHFMWPSHTINSVKFVATIIRHICTLVVRHAIQLPLLRIHLLSLFWSFGWFFFVQKMLCFLCTPTLNSSLILIIMAGRRRNRAKRKCLSFWQSTKTQLIFNSTFIEFNYPIRSPPLRR